MALERKDRFTLTFTTLNHLRANGPKCPNHYVVLLQKTTLLCECMVSQQTTCCDPLLQCFKAKLHYYAIVSASLSRNVNLFVAAIVHCVQKRRVWLSVQIHKALEIVASKSPVKSSGKHVENVTKPSTPANNCDNTAESSLSAKLNSFKGIPTSLLERVYQISIALAALGWDRKVSAKCPYTVCYFSFCDETRLWLNEARDI